MTHTNPNLDYIRLREVEDPIEGFNLFLRRNIPPAWLPHYLDSDDNEAEFVRRKIQKVIDRNPDVPPDSWINDHWQLCEFARVLVDADPSFDAAQQVCDFFEKPYKWEAEHQIWVDSGRPTSDKNESGFDRWDEFCEHLEQLP
jgi:hypothetical protein